MVICFCLSTSSSLLLSLSLSLSVSFLSVPLLPFCPCILIWSNAMSVWFCHTSDILERIDMFFIFSFLFLLSSLSLSYSSSAFGDAEMRMMRAKRRQREREREREWCHLRNLWLLSLKQTARTNQPAKVWITFFCSQDDFFFFLFRLMFVLFPYFSLVFSFKSSKGHLLQTLR